ncbi:hypothetical protein B4099_3225 [Heyndrickxia coagulans]|uniref:Uncharacterized protein n=1 Tax=Heyndrickxia coagulans TaxID=1398 RepID=A0A150KH11_HEYCO|nr:hypothetical protein B4099_3225 [Heyndrickxia coagulans]
MWGIFLWKRARGSGIKNRQPLAQTRYSNAGEEIDTSVKNYSLQVPVSFYIIDKRCE